MLLCETGTRTREMSPGVLQMLYSNYGNQGKGTMQYTARKENVTHRKLLTPQTQGPFVSMKRRNSVHIQVSGSSDKKRLSSRLSSSRPAATPAAYSELMAPVLENSLTSEILSD